MRAILLVSLVALAVLAGCFGGGKTPSPDTTVMTPTMTPMVHRSDARMAPASAYGGELPVFAERYVAERGGGEPTIGITADGVAIYPSIAFDLPGGLPSTRLMRSDDGGINWTDASPSIANTGDIRAAPASLDPYVYSDPVTGRLFNIDLNLAAGAFLSWSDDGAKTWTSNPGCCGLPVDDHQTLFAGPAKTLPANPLLYPGRVLYYCINQIASSTCTHSLDGGLTWAAPTQAFPGVQPGTDNSDPLSGFCGGLHGHGHASEKTGTVFLPKGQCGIPTVARSTDNGLTWQAIRLDDSFGIDGHEAIVSTDQAGNVYYFFLDKNALPRLSISRDDGVTWSTPLNVTRPGVTVAKFPSIVAGADGHVAFLYVGSTTPVGAHIWDSDPNGNPKYRSEQENATWNVYVGMTLDALAADPVFATVTAHNPADPVARGACAGRCQAVNGGMYDFLDIDIQPKTGQVWVAYVDNCNGDHPLNSIPCNSAHGDFSSYMRARAAVGVQIGGTLLGSANP